jgi:hypothetical protein
MRVTATRGPVPAGSDQRRRHNTGDPITRVPATGPVTAPPLDLPAYPIAGDWFHTPWPGRGRRIFFEPSYWQAARLVAFDLTRHLGAGRVSAQMLALSGRRWSTWLDPPLQPRHWRGHVHLPQPGARIPAGACPASGSSANSTCAAGQASCSSTRSRPRRATSSPAPPHTGRRRCGDRRRHRRGVPVESRGIRSVRPALSTLVGVEVDPQTHRQPDSSRDCVRRDRDCDRAGPRTLTAARPCPGVARLTLKFIDYVVGSKTWDSISSSERFPWSRPVGDVLLLPPGARHRSSTTWRDRQATDGHSHVAAQVGALPSAPKSARCRRLPGREDADPQHAASRRSPSAQRALHCS